MKIKYYIAIIATCFIFSFYFVPGNMYFLKFWSFFSISAFLCLVAKITFDKSNVLTFDQLKILAILTILAGVACIDTIPTLFLEDANLKKLHLMELKSINLSLTEQEPIKITNESEIQIWSSSLKLSKIFYPSRKQSLYNFSLVLESDSTTKTFDADIIQDYPDDIKLTYKNHLGYSYIWVPKMGKHLKQNNIINSHNK